MRLEYEAINAAAFLFEASRGNELRAFEQREIAEHGLANSDLEDVTKELMRWARDDQSNSDTRGRAYWALGKKCDSSLLLFFIESLRLELPRDLNATYQIMIALDNLGEPVFSKARKGYSFSEEELYRDDAEKYLAMKD